MPRAFGVTFALTLLALGACQPKDIAPEGAEQALLEALPGVYTGRFPCANCTAIVATLWLRPDGRFFLRQTYVDEDAALDAHVYAVGRWSRDTRGLLLSGRGPERRFVQLDPHRLSLETPSPLEHVLTRDPSAPPFTDTLRLEGETAIGEEGIRFSDCVTGLELEIARGPGYDELRRQHRRLNRAGAPSLTVVEAHLDGVPSDGAMRETLIVDRVVTLRPRVTC